MADSTGRTSRASSEWMRVMGEGQLTRDAVLRTRREIEDDRARAEALAERRRELFPEGSLATAAEKTDEVVDKGRCR